MAGTVLSNLRTLDKRGIRSQGQAKVGNAVFWEPVIISRVGVFLPHLISSYELWMYSRST